MNFLTYKTLTSEQRMEYDFKFGDKPRLDATKILLMGITLLSVAAMMTFVSYFIITDEKFVDLRESVEDMMSMAFNLVKISLGIVIIYVVGDFVGLIFYYAKRYWWRKKNSIKYIKGWPWRG